MRSAHQQHDRIWGKADERFGRLASWIGPRSNSAEIPRRAIRIELHARAADGGHLDVILLAHLQRFSFNHNPRRLDLDGLAKTPLANCSAEPSGHAAIRSGR